MNIRSLRNPDLYHGRIGRNYFEGWYFKLVNRDKNRVFAFIPGVFFNRDFTHSHAFIQVVDGMKRKYSYESFPTEQFAADQKMFELTVGKSSFGGKGISLNLNGTGTTASGQVSFSNTLKWPDTLTNPGSMGFYNYILKMQCYSQVCSMDFELSGNLNIDGEELDFSGGRGYIEKNWGSAFPYSWVWIQCNHFEKGQASLSCSLAHIPFLFTSFRGFLAGLYVGERFYAFTTMNRSSSEVFQEGTDITLHLKNHHHSLTIECETREEDFILLNGPRENRMIPLVQENLQGLVNITLKERSGGKVIYSDNGSCAGVEYGGEQMLIIDKSKP
jgi:hypothetical protein